MAKKKIIEEPIEEIKEEIKEEVKETKKDIPEYYVAKIGETIKDIAEKFGVSEEKINELNNNPEIFGGNQIKLK